MDHVLYFKIFHLFPDILFTSPDQNKELFVATKNLLQVMSMGQLLPPPFNYLHTVIEHFDPSEIATVLKECIWNYMREVVPSPVLFIVDNNGIFLKKSESSDCSFV